MSNRNLAGIRGHQKIQRSRPADYQKEISVEKTIETDDFRLRIRGRIDGLFLKDNSLILEEIKTIQNAWNGKANPLHWAQAKCYAAIYAETNALARAVIQLTYLELRSGKIHELQQSFSTEKLAEFLDETTTIYVNWLEDRNRWRESRNQAIQDLGFPFGGYRAGQREMAVATYKTMDKGGRLFISAPTGIGKTMSVLFPAIKALGEGNIERIYYLTARTVGREVAEKAADTLRHCGIKLITLTLTAKDKLCVRDGRPCDLETCPLAVGYYDRIRPAIKDLLSREAITRTILEEVSIKHMVCPFELSLDASLWVDVLICDYNYVFDPSVYLRRHFIEEENQYGFLIDEAHNLVDRAREMFSAELTADQMHKVEKKIKNTLPRCAKVLKQLRGKLAQLYAPETASEGSTWISGGDELPLSWSREFVSNKEARIVPELPKDLVGLVEEALVEIETWLVENKEAPFREELTELYFTFFSFARVAEFYDNKFATIVELQESISVKLFCVDPSTLLQHILRRGRAAVFFSATLSPLDYFRNLLGGDAQDTVIQLQSPFPPENLAVLINDRIKTNFKARSDSLSEVVDSIGTIVSARRGNYLAFFPSYQYLNEVLRKFRERFPCIMTIAQTSGMSETEKSAFLATFSVDQTITTTGFAVLGGIFGEGIDLIGERLIGAIIVGVGLPQLCVERNIICDYFQQENGHGFEYAYTFPGMNRVLQAVGRVIRSETDKGIVLLIDARFDETRYCRIFPTWWRFIKVRNQLSLRSAVDNYWQSHI